MPTITSSSSSTPSSSQLTHADSLTLAQDLIREKNLQHVAIIMDGNRRWANQHGKLPFEGHMAGYQTLRNLVAFCSEQLKLPVLTVYAFSTENWNRPSPEVEFITNLLQKAVQSELRALVEKNVQVRFIGDLNSFPSLLSKGCMAIQEDAEKNTGLVFQIALNYGGRAELLNAVRKVYEQLQGGEVTLDELDQEHISKALYTGPYPDPDMIIRTGGESRLSNFLLWQAAYAEIMVRQELWPEFSPDALLSVIEQFSQRHRRYGV